VEEVVELADDAGDDELEMFDKAFDSIGSDGGAPVASSTRFAEVPPDAEVPPARKKPPRPPTGLSARDDDTLLAGLDEPLDPPRKAAAPAKGDKELARVKEQLAAAEQKVQQLKDEAAKREAAARALQQRGDGVKKLEREVADLTAQNERVAEERDELRRQLDEAQAAVGLNEDRAVKAYAKIKAGEKNREKARKALQIALQLLEENAAEDDGEDGEKLSAKA
jgi:hypothetical protein